MTLIIETEKPEPTQVILDPDGYWNAVRKKRIVKEMGDWLGGPGLDKRWDLHV